MPFDFMVYFILPIYGATKECEFQYSVYNVWIRYHQSISVILRFFAKDFQTKEVSLIYIVASICWIAASMYWIVVSMYWIVASL